MCNQIQMIVVRHSSSPIEYDLHKYIVFLLSCFSKVQSRLELMLIGRQEEAAQRYVPCINYAFSNHIPICSATNDMQMNLMHSHSHDEFTAPYQL